MTKLYGFTLLRNGVKYDYPFKESFSSLAPLVEKLYVALGDSEDVSEEALAALPIFPKIKLIRTMWDLSLREGGLIMSEQTNVALNTLRREVKEEGAWGFYIQADEVIHESDYEIIKRDIERAHSLGYEAVRFRYLHFWQTHAQIAINKKWYPSEIRAIRLSKSTIESWGDAQSFRGIDADKIYDSDAYIFHYGHVREGDSYRSKKADILKLYHRDGRLKKYKRREARYDRQTKCIAFCGFHPQVMKERILRLGDEWDYLNELNKSTTYYVVVEDEHEDEEKLDKVKPLCLEIIPREKFSILKFWKERKRVIIMHPRMHERL
ncbi:MAG: hypothetical protein HQK50_17160, partial [Oligoflexia bacterium]|nr:hypothetical protein [Oligoflexia bacterium]